MWTFCFSGHLCLQLQGLSGYMCYGTLHCNFESNKAKDEGSAVIYSLEAMGDFLNDVCV